MAAEGNTYALVFCMPVMMIDKQGNPKVIEVQLPPGDPETQPIMPRSEVRPGRSSASRRLRGQIGREKPPSGMTARRWVWWIAAGGYPGNYNTGDEIFGLPQQEAADGKVFPCRHQTGRRPARRHQRRARAVRDRAG
ncbi:hypothetical protein LNP25_09480 [Klebsiella variicola subsp. variicola]|nr:hypothetical protein [Klebsiella variicola subsp. variicola]